ncbi:MAG TPA: hypothetical protein VGR87_11150 [Candidatus Limnocylindria bacterium]|jgi:hypothetical protein|nr:hypothetical protein [Candidatus Limnocylindria bacterium]
MIDDTLARALGSLKAARMDDVASDVVRKRLEKAWADRATRRTRSGLVVGGFMRAFAVAALLVGLAFTTLHAGADSPLYATRVSIENALIAFQADPVAYATQLYDERLEEAARFEAAGNALAASRARDAQQEALRLLTQIAPQPSEQSPEPSASTVITLPSPSPSPEASAEPSESPTPSPTPTPRTPPPAVRTPTPTPKPTVKPTLTPKPTVKPSPTPVPTPMTVHATGDVLYADGSKVDGACVSMSFDGMCFAGTINGKVDVQLTAKKGQTITLYLRNYDAARGGTLRGKVSVTVGGPEVLLGTITLRPG